MAALRSNRGLFVLSLIVTFWDDVSPTKTLLQACLCRIIGGLETRVDGMKISRQSRVAQTQGGDPKLGR